MATLPLRTGFLVALVSIFSLMPFDGEGYYPNTAHLTLQTFLYQQIYRDQLNFSTFSKNYSINKSMTTTGDDDLLKALNNPRWRVVWSVYSNMGMGGEITGSLVVPSLNRLLGRRHAILTGLISALPFRAMQAFASLDGLWIFMFLGRFGSGISYGIIYSTLPVFITEVSPSEHRGRLGVLQVVGFCIGGLLGVLLGLRDILGHPTNWYYVYIVFMGLEIPAIAACLKMPNSPVDLLHKNAGVDAIMRSLNFYHGNTSKMNTVRLDAETMANENSRLGSFLGLFRIKSLRKSLLLGFLILLPYTPVILVQYYSTIMFELAQFSNKLSIWLTVGLMVLSLIIFFICLFITDKFSRKKQYFVSLMGTSLALIAMGVLLLLHLAIPFAISFYVYEIFLCFGTRPLYWVLIPELFPFQYRASGQALMNLSSLIITFLISTAFLPLLSVISGWTYLILALPMCVSAGFFWKYYPETRNEDVTKIFSDLSQTKKATKETETLM